MPKSIYIIFFCMMQFISNFALSDSIKTPEKEDFFLTLGIHESDLKSPNKSKLEPTITPKMYNFLTLNSIDSMTRTLLYSQESCGARSYQFITLQNVKANDGLLFVFYPCSGKCLGSSEKTVGKSKQSSNQINLPVDLCKFIWGRSMNFVEINGL